MSLLLAALACASRGTVPLALAEGSEAQRQGDLRLQAEAELEHSPTRGYQLRLRLELEYRGQERSRIDLSRAMVRSGARGWEPCRLPPDLDRSTLLFALDPGQRAQVELRCEDIAEPRDGLVLRFPATGTGAASGAVELTWTGTR